MRCFLASPKPRRSEDFFSACWSPPARTATGACGFRPVRTPVGGHASLGMHTNSRSHKHRAQSPKHTTQSKGERKKLFIPAVCFRSPQTSMWESKDEPCERTKPKYRNRDICELLTKFSSLINHFQSSLWKKSAKTCTCNFPCHHQMSPYSKTSTKLSKSLPSQPLKASTWSQL